MTAPALTDAAARLCVPGAQPIGRVVDPRWREEVAVALRSTFGYLDAGTGSIVVQVFIGRIAAIAVTVRLWPNGVLRLLHPGPCGGRYWRDLPRLKTRSDPASGDRIRMAGRTRAAGVRQLRQPLVPERKAVFLTPGTFRDWLTLATPVGLAEFPIGCAV
jgi:hypothetical protein